MIKDIVLQAALGHEFTVFDNDDDSNIPNDAIDYSAGGIAASLEGIGYESLTYFSQHSGDRKRFLAVEEVL